ncbi:MAG: hypothetical protein ABUS54_07900 [Actinomycetota bacterium]
MARTSTLLAACVAALVVALPAGAKTPPALVVAKVGIEVAKLGIASGAVDQATAKCSSKACLSKSYTAYFAQARVLDAALEDLWSAAGKSGPCANAAADAGAGFDALTKDYRAFEAATLAADKPTATKVYGRIEATVTRLTAVVDSFKTKCR